MAARGGADVLIVSLGSTAGLREADAELAASIERAGARVQSARAAPPSRELPTLALTDLAWAHAARAAAREALLASRPRSIIYSSTTAALLWPVPGAIRFDATAAGNRPGRHGIWQRPLERRRLVGAPLLVPWSEGALTELETVGAARPGSETEIQAAGGAGARSKAGGLRERAVVVPVPVEPSGGRDDGAGEPERDIAVLTYGANPVKKGLDRVLEAWVRVLDHGGPPGGGRLVIAGASEQELGRAGIETAGRPAVEVVGRLERPAYRALLRRARTFACAPRREDYGIAQLEALAEGCQLVTTPAPGPYAALPIARELDPRLVGADLTGALRAALAEPLPGYARRAAAALVRFGRAEVDRLVAEQLLPRLLA
jgi:glycosyltransferase involved in cell wall biosynthesis